MLTLFFVDEISSGETQELSKDEAHHAIKVLRLNLGESIKISDGAGIWVSGPITEIKKKSLQISIQQRGEFKKIEPELILIQAITKSDRSKDLLELVTQAGVDQIIPWQSQRSISKWQPDFATKWQITIKESCKQSRRVKMPELRQVHSTNQIIEKVSSGSLGVVFHEGAKAKLSDQIFPTTLDSIYLIIGPEGGITDEEINIFTKANFAVVSLGQSVFRSAHAGFAALSAVQTKLGRW